MLLLEGTGGKYTLQGLRGAAVALVVTDCTCLARKHTLGRTIARQGQLINVPRWYSGRNGVV